jgi:mRNA interferase MazF
VKIEKFGVYLADLDPRSGTEPGKIRPVVVIQTNMLNDISHSSTLVCPMTSKVDKSSKVLRVHLSKKESGMEKDTDILVDQVRGIDNRRLIRKIGYLSKRHAEDLLQNLHYLIFQ